MIEIGALLTIFATTAVLIGLLYLPGIKTNINFADEGYLWHGTLKVLEGEIPIRDFRAYDPGRYYWCAFWFRLFGSNLLSLRIGLFTAQFLALSAGLVVVYISTHQWQITLISGLLMATWMLPLHKQVDILFSMLTPLIAVLLVSNPVESQYVISGIYIISCLFFGLNHGIYAGGALSLLIMLMGFYDHGLALTESLGWYSVGLCLGALPILALFIFVPRLFEVYWQQKISRIVKRKSANLPLPVPWLWTSKPAQLAQLNKCGQLIVKLLFTFMPVMYVAFIFFALITNGAETNLTWPLIAIACTGLFYLHHAFSRADFSHLSQSIAPLFMCLAILLSNYSYGWLTMAAITVLSINYIYLAHCDWLKHFFNKKHLEEFNAGETSLWIPPEQARYLAKLSDLIESHSQPGEAVLLLPNLVTLYPMLQRKSAVYDIFCVYPASAEEENNMIEELSEQAVGFALINNSALDSREELRFSHTHPKVWQYLNREFKILNEEGIPADHYAFISRV